LVFTYHEDSAGQLGHISLGTFLLKGFELCHCLEIARSADGSLGANQPFQIQTADLHAEEFEHIGVRQEILIASSARNFPQQIEISEVGSQSEVEALVNRLIIPTEGQSKRRSSEIWFVPGKSSHERSDVR
jgi:hypothetical protein